MRDISFRLYGVYMTFETQHLVFNPIVFQVNELEKKLKFRKKRKNVESVLQVWWISAFPKSLALICLMVSEKKSLSILRTTDDGQTTTNATAVGQLAQSIRAKKLLGYFVTS